MGPEDRGGETRETFSCSTGNDLPVLVTVSTLPPLRRPSYTVQLMIRSTSFFSPLVSRDSVRKSPGPVCLPQGLCRSLVSTSDTECGDRKVSVKIKGLGGKGINMFKGLHVPEPLFIYYFCYTQQGPVPPGRHCDRDLFEVLPTLLTFHRNVPVCVSFTWSPSMCF